MHPRLNTGLIPSLFLIGVMIGLSSCASSGSQQGAVSTGVQAGESGKVFRHRWWNYYERAVSRMKRGFYQEAEEDFFIALKKRSRDGRRARTYGMHFSDYFPHRELGILYFRQGKLDASEQELLTSIRQYPSAKASFYLNRTRQKKIKKGGLDTKPPSIVLDGEDGLGKPTNAFSIHLSGKVIDDQYASGLTIQGKHYRIEQAAAEVSFQQTVKLVSGVNVIEVVAQDLAGNQTERKLKIIVDRQGPQISVDEIKLGEVQSGMRLLAVTGLAWDKQPIREINIAGHQVAIKSGTGVFRSEFRVSENVKAVPFHAEDALGNQSNGSIEIDVQPVSSVAEVKRPAILLASAESQVVSDVAPVWIRLARSDVGQSYPPRIQVKDMDSAQEVFWDRVFLEGKVIDDTKVMQLDINGLPVLQRPGKQVFFSSMLPLKIGENSIVIHSVDEGGNISEQNIKIVRKQKKVKKLGQRMTVSLLPLEKKGDVSVASEVAEDNLLNALVELRRFQLVERSHLKEILGELKLSASELVNPATAAHVGEISAASMVMMGSIVEDKSGIEVVARVVDTETSEIIAVKDVYEDDKSLNKLHELMEGLASKLDHTFPLIQGLLIQRDGERILIDVGEGSGLRRGMRLISFRKGNTVIPEPFKSA
ncbi:MAG: CsgG/HfaB family protein, partial [Flavobacteriales bacterium]